MVFWVIVYIDSYLYTQKKIATPLYMGVGVKQNSQSKNGTRSNRDPKYDMYDTLPDVKFTLHSNLIQKYNAVSNLIVLIDVCNLLIKCL